MNPGTPILVTGATGFIGGRTCERLVQGGFRNVRALVRDFSNAARISRLPIELRQGNLLDPQSLSEALGDSKIVFHLGLGYGPGIVTGTQNLLKIAAVRGVERFIHISTTAVYGLRPSASAETETARPRSSGNIYCDYKLRAEKEVLHFISRGLRAVILRPSIVIGPYSRWSINLMSQLRQGRYALIDQGKGICNTTYVDNLIDGMFLATDAPEAVGQIFTITDGERVTWEDFIRAHARMLQPEPRLEAISSADIARYYKSQPGIIKASLKAGMKLLLNPDFRELLKQVPIADRMIMWAWYRTQAMTDLEKARFRARLGWNNSSLSAEKATSMPDQDTVGIQTASVLFAIDKARRVLGYSPRIHFLEAMQRTEQWLTFANFL